jgi:hypothetical protein
VTGRIKLLPFRARKSPVAPSTFFESSRHSQIDHAVVSHTLDDSNSQ